jgi:hypothetical protein
VLLNPPYVESKDGKPGYGYSDVKQDSERYANMWYYGLTPYRKHMYEYPPIAIPFVYIPLLVDLAHIGHYYQNYRVEIFLFECVLFAMMIKTISKIWQHQLWRQVIALSFYCLIGAIGKDYWYEGLDLLLIGFYVMALMTQYWWGRDKLWKRVVFWALFSASFGVKYMTAPMALPLFWMQRKKWKQEILAGMIGFLLVWGVPIVLYRSSLSVMVLFHTVRPLKYGAFGTWVVWAINDFTHSEVQTNILPHLPIVGPVAAAVEKMLGILFPLSILLSVGWSTFVAHVKTFKSREHELQSIIYMTLVYFMAIFFTNKVFSSPFHIWYVPLITLLPLESIKTQLWLMAGSFWTFLLDTTPWIKMPDVKLGQIVPAVRIRDLTRFIPFVGFLGYATKRLHGRQA